MFSVLKPPIKSVLALANLSVSRTKAPEPFVELWNVPRFTEHTVDLLDRPFRIADSRSFFFSYREIFVEEIYRFNCDTPAPRIVDCGSNFGTSIVYFKNLFPSARITGVEADPGIFSLLRSNTSHLDVELLNKAVSDTREPLTFFSEGSDSGRAHHAIETGKTVQVQAVTLDDLIDGSVDFLKIDIEGSEGDAIEACTKLALVKQMFIEYHSFKDSEQTLGRLLSRLSNEGFRYYIHKQFCSPAPLTIEATQLGMDLQLNIFAKRVDLLD